MFKACHLHIGMEKTGSTTIQTMMAANRGRLLRHGYHYSWSMGATNHVNLVVYAREDDTSDNQRKRALSRAGTDLPTFRADLETKFAQEAEKHDGRILLLSNEHLQSRVTTIGEKQRLKEFLDQQVAAPVQIYMYVRRQDLAATSLYGTRLLSGAKIGFGKVLPTLQDNAPLPYFYDYLLIWREWCTVFGRENVQLRVFEPGKLAGDDVALDYLEWLGLENIEDWVIPDRQNESITAAAQYLMSRMNLLNPAFSGAVPNPLRGQANLRVIRTSRGAGLKPARADAQRFYAAFRADNAQLFKEAGVPQANFTETFDQFPETAGETQIPAQDLADASIALFQDVVAELVATRAELQELKKRQN